MSPSTSPDEDEQIPGQTTISCDETVKPSTEGIPCNWCSAPAVLVFEIMKKVRAGWIGTQMHVYCCRECRDRVERVYGAGVREVKDK